MTKMNIENLEVPQIDPAWDYAQVWQSLHKIKFKINSAIMLIAQKEQSDSKTDEQLKAILEVVSGELDELIEFDLASYLEDDE